MEFPRGPDYGKQKPYQLPLFLERMEAAGSRRFLLSLTLLTRAGTDIDDAMSKMSFFYKKEDVIRMAKTEVCPCTKGSSEYLNACIKQAYPKARKGASV